MKYFLMFMLGVISTLTTYAQIPDGIYTTHDEKLIFSGDSIVYHLNTHSCVVNDYIGKGVYTISKKKLIIKPIVSVANKSIIQPVKGKSPDTLYLDICDDWSKSPIKGASIMVMRNYHMFLGYATSLNGRGILRSKLLNTDSIKVSYIAYRGIVFKPEQETDYKIMMKAGSYDKAEQAYVSNEDKGYVYRLTKTGFEINFVQTKPCGKKSDNWIVFKKQ